MMALSAIYRAIRQRNGRYQMMANTWPWITEKIPRKTCCRWENNDVYWQLHKDIGEGFEYYNNLSLLMN